VAIKRLDSAGPVLAARFSREIRVTASLQHPGTPAVLAPPAAIESAAAIAAAGAPGELPVLRDTRAGPPFRGEAERADDLRTSQSVTESGTPFWPGLGSQRLPWGLPTTRADVARGDEKRS
jgi:hypothetical protein